MVEAAQVGRRGRRACVATGRHALHVHAGLAHTLGFEVGVALLRCLVQLTDERARFFELFGRRRLDPGELLEQLRMVADGIMQLGDSFACDLVEGGGLFVGGTPHVVTGLRRLGTQRVLELDEPRPQGLFEGDRLLGGDLAHGVV